MTTQITINDFWSESADKRYINCTVVSKDGNHTTFTLDRQRQDVSGSRTCTMPRPTLRYENGKSEPIDPNKFDWSALGKIIKGFERFERTNEMVWYEKLINCPTPTEMERVFFALKSVDTLRQAIERSNQWLDENFGTAW